MSDLLGRFHRAYQKALIFAAWGALGAAIASLLGEIIRSHESRETLTQVYVIGALYFGIVGAGIGMAILIGYSTYMKRGFQLGGSLKGGAIPGFIAGAIGSPLADFFYISLGRGEIVRILSWGIAGGLLGLGLSCRIRNLGLWRGLGGGAVGGIVGGALFVFLVISLQLGGFIGRATGNAANGFFIGLMIVLAEALFREAWLEVKYGAKETRNVSLGAEPVSVGADASTCIVYARDTIPVAFRYKLDQGRVTCEDVAKGQTATVQPGANQVVGNLTVTVRAAGAAAQAAPAPQSAAARTASGFILRLSTGKTVSLADGVKLSTTDIPGLQASNGTTVAEVGRNPNDPSILGLKNLSRTAWTATLANRDRVQVDGGRNVRLAVGTKISFGLINAEIQ